MLVQVYEELYGSALMDSWQKCWSQVGGNSVIDIVETEMSVSGGGQEGVPFMIVNPTVKINKQQYRGNLETVSLSLVPCGSVHVSLATGVARQAECTGQAPFDRLTEQHTWASATRSLRDKLLTWSHTASA